MNDEQNQPIQPQVPTQTQGVYPNQQQSTVPQQPVQTIQPTQTVIPQQPQATAHVAPQPTIYQQPTQQSYTPAHINASPKVPRKVILGGAIGLVVIVIVGVVLMTALHKKAITFADVEAASQLSSRAETDISNADYALSEMESSTISTADVTSKAAVVSTKLSDAQKQFDLLKKSPVLGDAAVKQKFQLLDKKWQPYVTYIQNNAKDYASLAPLTSGFESQLDSLSNTAPTASGNAALATYIASFKSALDDTNTKAANLKMNIDVNQKSLDLFKTFIQSSLKDVATAQSDLSAGKDTFTVEEDLFKIDDEASTYSHNTLGIYDQISAADKLLNPASSFEQFNTALETLGDKTTK